MSAGEEIVVGGRSHWDTWHERTEERIVAAYQAAKRPPAKDYVLRVGARLHWISS